jgi:gamma-glutamylcyclotransferase (GGCT)/AIG2-like uncharacterized protein YtfP
MDTFEPHNVLFVYGALMRGRERVHFLSKEKARFLGPATANGTLHVIGDIPGLVLNHSVNDPSTIIRGAQSSAPSSLPQSIPVPEPPLGNDRRVHGELFEIFDPATFFDTLDVIEGYWPDQIERSLFVRKLVSVTDANGVTATAWAYVLNLPLNGASRFDPDE